MEWILISNATTGIREYHLLQGDRVMIVLKYSLEQQSVRIAFDNEHQVFFLENMGYANRIAFKNAYGVDQGKFSHNNRSNSGRLEINHAVYDYNIVDTNQPKLIIHQHNKQEPLAVCQIPAIPTRESAVYEQACMVLSVCWFTKMPASPQKTESVQPDNN
ncbi:MAG TPA: hypothetical protein VF008_29175 [Niastella sp.]